MMKNLLAPCRTVDFYDKVTGNILATIQDLGGYNWGCVKVEVDRSGTGAQWVTGDPRLSCSPSYLIKRIK
jgi:hypothetical protein